MTDPVEDLLVRTLRDPARDLPAPADPVPAIRHRARAQRRNAALGLAAVVLVVAATLLAPVAAGRFTRPAPVATELPPRGSGLLEWPASGPLAGDARLFREAVGRWRQASDGGPTGLVGLVWAGRVGTGRVVLLQAPGADGSPTLALLADRGGALTLLLTEPIADAGVAALRLVGEVAGGADRTLLVTRPGAASVGLMITPAVYEPVSADGLVAVGGRDGGRPVVVLDREDRVLGDGYLPPVDHMALMRGDVRLGNALWDGGGDRRPASEDYDGGQLLGAALHQGWSSPVEVAVLADGVTLNLDSGRKAQPRFYELHRDGRTYLGWIVWIDNVPYCEHLDDVTGTGTQPDALVLRCDLPRDHSGLVWVTLHTGIRMTGVRIEAAGPGEKALVETYRDPVDGGLATGLSGGLPTGPGVVHLEDDGGLPRPDIRLPRYKP